MESPNEQGGMVMLSPEQREDNARQGRYRDYYDTEGRSLRDIERELREIKLLLADLTKHLGAR
mgnify:CR=1 FL=1|tara:strand:+ start:230 stop:418 length:189 start_codon:yes stop_codon:yes gene_type:complete